MASEQSYFEAFGSDDSITDDDAIAVLMHLLPEYGARFISLTPTRTGRREYRYWSDRYNYGRSCSLHLPKTRAEFEQLLRRDLGTPLR